MHTKAMQSRTFKGRGGVLVVVPDYSPTPETQGSNEYNEYERRLHEREACEVVDWLYTVFSDKTIEEIRKNL